MFITGRFLYHFTMRRKFYKTKKSSSFRSKVYGGVSRPSGSRQPVVPSRPSGDRPKAPTSRSWSDPLGLGRPDPGKYGLYDVYEAKDGQGYMNLGDRWVIPGASNWRDARKYNEDRNPSSWWSQWRYNPNHGSVRPLYPREEL